MVARDDLGYSYIVPLAPEPDRMTTVTRREPIFNAPLGVVVVLGLLFAIHIGRSLLPTLWDNQLVQTLAFVPQRLFGDVVGLPGGVLVRYGQLVTHAALHVDYMHLGMNAVWLLVGGTVVTRRVGMLRMVALGLGATAAGAIMFAVLNNEPNAIVLGASGGISGLLGAATRLIHAAQASGDMAALREHIERLRCPPLLQALVDQQVVVSTTAFIALNVAIAFGLGSELSANGIAWQTHVGGYLFGLLAFGLFDRQPPAFDVTNADAVSRTLH